MNTQNNQFYTVFYRTNYVGEHEINYSSQFLYVNLVVQINKDAKKKTKMNKQEDDHHHL